MSRIKKIVMLTAFALAMAKVSAYDFQAGKLYYNIISMKSLTAEITKGDSPYWGDISIPSQVTYNDRTFAVIAIGEYAFNNSRLNSVDIPNSITEIGNYAFSLSKLESIEIPNSVTKIGESAFEECDHLTSVQLPNSVSKIGKYAFNNCKRLPSINIPNSVTEIGTRTFYNCSALSSITIPSSTTKIAVGAFEGCTKLAEVKIPNSVTEIEKWAFHRCENLIYIHIPNSVTKIGEETFAESALTDIHISESLDRIERKTFANCKYLESVTIPKSVTYIGDRAFYACDRLTSINIPDAVTEIGEYAFHGNDALNTVAIGKSVQTIGRKAFFRCSIDKFYCRLTTPPTYSHNEDKYPSDHLYEATLYVPIGCKSVYSQAEPWKNFKRIEERDFSGAESVGSDEIRVTAADGRIVATGTEGEEMTVYNTAGQLVYSGTDTTIDVPTTGIYIVRVAGQTFKVAL